jgi:hypothetical protein
MDNDDEVRDRATYFRAILDKQEAALNSMYILNGMQVGGIFISVGNLSYYLPILLFCINLGSTVYICPKTIFLLRMDNFLLPTKQRYLLKIFVIFELQFSLHLSTHPPCFHIFSFFSFHRLKFSPN